MRRTQPITIGPNNTHTIILLLYKGLDYAANNIVEVVEEETGEIVTIFNAGCPRIIFLIYF